MSEEMCQKRGQRIVAAGLLFGAAACAEAAPAPKPPRLVVVLVADQMRADYIEQFGPRFSAGLKRLRDQGAYFKNAAYPYANTVTCAGHATISTGAVPVKHRIAGNVWWDRAAGQLVTCTSDPRVRPISYGPAVTGGDSASRLAVPSLAEEMRAQLGPGSRAVTVSSKARSAIMLAGHRADAATWFDTPAGAWVSSSAYSDKPVPFVEAYVKAHPVVADFGRSWERVRPPSDYLFTDEGVGERPLANWTRAFPHVLRGRGDAPDGLFYLAWDTSPFSDAYLGGLARAAVDGLHLGQGPSTDFLGVSFSALDMVGHRFGPRSHEIQDVLFRLDTLIGELLDHLDKVVGPDNYVVALSADHGVAAVPEQAAAEGADAGRVVAEDLARRLDRALEPALGPGTHVVRASYADLYFKPGDRARIAGDPALLKTVMDTLLAVPGVARVIRPEELPAVKEDDAIGRAVAASYVADRSGDLVVIPKPNWLVVSSAAVLTGQATTHGSPNIYDRRVPIVLMGPGVRPGVRDEAATPADIAPTLAHFIGVRLPSATGRVLSEALVDSKPAVTSAPATEAKGRHR
jgi:type I phosphodiesterase/nucleotide pyrophosphatase